MPPNSKSVDDQLATKVVAVVVTYLPDARRLAATLLAVLPQVKGAIVVDNGSPRDLADDLKDVCSSKCFFLRLTDNLGIAKAQNIGIQWARERGATHVMLLDQDSQPEQDMVTRLLRTALELQQRGIQLAAVAPVYVDARRKKLKPFSRLGRLRARRFGCDAGKVVVETDAAIASGSLTPVASLAAIGGMREELFIDLVDTEWCLRARSMGYRSFGVCDAVLRHSLGAQPRTFANRTITHHSPLRSYYFFRNAVWLIGRRYAPTAWKFAVARQLLQRLLFYPLAVAPRLQYLRMMSLGVWHGLWGRLGRFDLAASASPAADED